MASNGHLIAMLLAFGTVGALFALRWGFRLYREGKHPSPTPYGDPSLGASPQYTATPMYYPAPPLPPVAPVSPPPPTSAGWMPPDQGGDMIDTGWGLLGAATPNAVPVQGPPPVLYTPTSAKSGGGGLDDQIKSWMAAPERWGRGTREGLISAAVVHFGCGSDVARRAYTAVANDRRRHGK